MAGDMMTRPATESHYCDLVRIAYFVLPGKGKRAYRLAIARRIVDEAAIRGRRGTRAGLARRRTRVLRKAMRPSRRLQIGLGPWLRALPTRLPDPTVTGILSRLDPHVRVAYVLRRVEGMPRYAVRDQLVALRVRDPWPVIDAADAVEVPDGRHPERFEPTLVRPVRRRPLLPIAAASALTATLAGAMVMTERGGSSDGASRPGGTAVPRLVAAAPDAWRQGRRTLDVWPARGDLAGDKVFIGRAAKAWAGAPGTRDEVQLLYAGHAGAASVALMRRGERLARFTGTGGTLDAVAAGTDPSAPFALGGGRYLLAPWDAKAETLAGRTLAVHDGVTDPVPARTRCGRGPLFTVKGPSGTRTVGDLGGPRAAVLTYHSPGYRPTSAPEPPASLGPLGLRFWDRLGCQLPQPARPVVEAMAWDFWSGTLPFGGKAADWACTRMTFAGGGTAAQATLLGATEQYATGWCDDRRPLSGLWWQAPTQRWYYLAAAGRGLRPHAEGSLRSSATTDGLLVGTPADPRRRSQVTLTTKDT